MEKLKGNKEESKKCTTEVMTEAQFVQRLVSQGTSTSDMKTKTEKEKKMPPSRGLQMLLQEIEKTGPKYEPEPEKEKRRRNPLPWEHGMVAMMQDLKGSINRDSDHYKSLKEGLLTTRKDFIQGSKKSILFFKNIFFLVFLKIGKSTLKTRLLHRNLNVKKTSI
jgi:hypothetical protein